MQQNLYNKERRDSWKKANAKTAVNFSATLLLFIFLISFSSASIQVGLDGSLDEIGINFIPEDRLNDLSDVSITNPTTLQLLLYNQSSNIWYNSYLNDSVHSVNASYYWLTDKGALSNPSDINHNWLSNLLWSVAGHVMDTFLDMNGNSIIDVWNVNISNALNFIGGGYIEQANYIQFNTTWTDGTNEARLQWNSEDGTLEVGMPGGDVNLQIGQEMLVRAKNVEGEDITNCQAVWVSGATGGVIEIMTPIASNVSQAPLTFGLATETITNNQLGYITLIGLVRGCDTSDWSTGDVLYLSETEEGNLTNVAPVAPNTKVIIGIVTRSHSSEGIIATNPVVVQRVITSSDVYPVGLTSASILRYNSTSNRFEISTSYTTEEVDELVGGVNIDFLLHNTSSGISTYWDMNTTDSRPKNSTSYTITTDEQELGGFISPNASDLGISTIAAGLAEAHFHANVNSVTGVKLVSGFFRFYIRHDNGTEVLISSSELVPVRALTETEYSAHAIILEDISLEDGDRILVKSFTNFSGGGGGNPILTTYIQGETASRIEISTTGVNFATKGDLKNYVPYTGATGNVNLGDNNLTSDFYFLGNGAYIGYNATCQMIFYNSTGSIMSTQGCT